ncbi:IS1-like element transposase [Niabella ginsengisoli]|uniref:IS1-like element transposase n=1 Tax=Niabella ginsengisoli TaxID=522298 RepID=UPI00374D5B9C
MENLSLSDRCYTNELECWSCKCVTIKYGRTACGVQRRRCKSCGKTRVAQFQYKAYNPNINNLIILLTKEGMGIRSTARVLQISATTLLKRLVSIARPLSCPVVYRNKTYELDELCTYVKKISIGMDCLCVRPND